MQTTENIAWPIWPEMNFPKAVHLKDPSKTVVMGDTLATAINATLFASGNDDLRPVMSGVFFNSLQKD